MVSSGAIPLERTRAKLSTSHHSAATDPFTPRSNLTSLTSLLTHAVPPSGSKRSRNGNTAAAVAIPKRNSQHQPSRETTTNRTSFRNLPSTHIPHTLAIAAATTNHHHPDTMSPSLKRKRTDESDAAQPDPKRRMNVFMVSECAKERIALYRESHPVSISLIQRTHFKSNEI